MKTRTKVCRIIRNGTILALIVAVIGKILYDVLSTIYDWGLLFESLIAILVLIQIRSWIKKLKNLEGED